MALTKLTNDLNIIQALANRIRGQAATVKAKFDEGINVIKNYINNTLTVEIDALDAQNVKLTGDQTISGVKTFNSSPVVPEPTSSTQPATKNYVDIHKTSADHDSRYYTETEIDTKLSDLAGAGRTTETVKGNADNIAALSSTVAANETDIENKLANLAGTGRTTETVKGTYDDLQAHKSNMTNPHNTTASQVGAYSKTEMQTSGQAQLHWDNVTNKPAMADNHWKPPVATVNDLPMTGNTDGDLRIVLNTDTVYTWDATTNAWKVIGASGNGISDHGTLIGLGDDDHPQYLRTDGTRKLTGDLDINYFMLKNMRVHVSATAPSPSYVGMLWYDTANDKLKVMKATGWVDVSGVGALIKDKKITATEGQTVLDISDVGKYQPGTNAMNVYKKNASGRYELLPENAYTETNTTTVTLVTGATAGDEYYLKWFENSPSILNAIQEVLGEATYSTEAVHEGGIFSFDASTAENSPLRATVKGRTATNLIKNGNFVDGNYWTPAAGTGSVSNNIYTLTGNGTAAVVQTNQSTSEPVRVGHKIYTSCYVRVTNSNCNLVQTRITGTLGGTTVTGASQASPVINNWYRLSSIITVGADWVGNILLSIQHQYADAPTANGKVMEIREVMGINLTVAGLESKTVSEINAMFPSWFDGTKPTLGGVVRRVGKNKANPNGFNFSINPLTGMRVGNNHETDYTISKAFIPTGEKAVNSINGIKFPTNVYLYAENGNYLGNNQRDNTFTAEVASQSYNRICYILVPKYKDYGNNIWIADNAGLPSLMVYIPKFKISDVITGGSNNTHPAFIVNGIEVPGIYISKFQNVIYNGKAYILPCKDPANSINFDTARQACEAKGAGWHLMTYAEWAAIALWCRKNSLMPKGNNNYGKDHSESTVVAIPTYMDGSNIGRVATGTGPVTWSHNGQVTGIWDLNGNVWEWCGGYRTLGGEIHILPNNNAADPNNSQASGSTLWRAILEDGSLTDPGADGTLKWDYVDSTITLCKTITNQADASRSMEFKNLGKAAEVSAVPEILKALALYPADNGGHGGDYFCMNNGAGLERLASRGGSWLSGASAGVFALYGASRSISYTSVGFRSAFIPGI